MSNTTTRTARWTWYNIAWRAGRILLIVYLLLLLAMMFLENSLIYFPRNYPEDD